LFSKMGRKPLKWRTPIWPSPYVLRAFRSNPVHGSSLDPFRVPIYLLVITCVRASRSDSRNIFPVNGILGIATSVMILVSPESPGCILILLQHH
jgi:hypothetical protein